jgi:superfamily I DNA/RNA helicase
VPAEQKVLLSQSYRVPGAVRDHALTWIESQIHTREPVEYKSRSEAGSVSVVDAGYKLPDRLRPIIEACYADSSTCMILATCRYMLTPLIRLLRTWGIPYANPYRSEDGSWNPLRFGTSKGLRLAAVTSTKLDRMMAFLASNVELFGDRNREWTWKDIALWTEPLRATGDDAVLAHGVKARVKKRAALVGDMQPYSMLDFGDLFVDGWTGPHAKRAHQADMDWWIDGMLEKHQEGFKYLNALYKARGARILFEAPRTWVGTIHSVKGGEADTVILFPDVSPSSDRNDWSEGEHDETARLFYVAMTRARSHLVLCTPESPHHARISSGSTPIHRGLTKAECEAPF